MKRFILAVIFLYSGLNAHSADVVTKDFHYLEPVIDSLLMARTSVRGQVHITKVVLSQGRLNFQFGESISNFPLRPKDTGWLRARIQNLLPEEYAEYSVGEITGKNDRLFSLAVADPGNSGVPSPVIKSVDIRGPQPVNHGIEAKKGLTGRNIAMWQSHGLYYNNETGKWIWQRPVMFEIVEDLFTQSFVVPFLAPMLENAGANVFLPRERDWHKEEIIIDNDDNESTSGRIHGQAIEYGRWDIGRSGFADLKPYYIDGESPFFMGSFLSCASTRNAKKASKVAWEAEIPHKGEYAVYVTYPMLPDSCPSVVYTVHTAGGDVHVNVNQRIGGGVWEYIGTYEFASGTRELVSVSNYSKEKGTICADAVKIGGGMGCIARPSNDSTRMEVSDRPRFSEGARYFLQWAGFPEKVWGHNDGGNDYRDDLMSRGEWVKYLMGGSRLDAKGKGLGIPIDMSLAWHTDAGTFQNDSIVGTLAIYTLKCNNSENFVNGESRRACRELTDYVQSEVTGELRRVWDKKWTRRQIWNRSYSESRTTGVPAVLLELLSHQNFEDMKYGLDPAFRFTAARGVYKGILKYLSARYNCPYAVQPLPVRDFCAILNGMTKGGNRRVELRWRTTEDTAEPTSEADGFIVYTRVNQGGWDSGTIAKAKERNGVYSIDVPIAPGHVYSFKVAAFNEGGISFPSEVMSAGFPDDKLYSGNVKVINDFHRVSGPVWFDSPSYAGFDNEVDGGVPYLRDWCFTGAQTEFDRNKAFKDDNNCGFGASDSNYSDDVTGGNSFDYIAMHGRTLMQAGYSFDSCSASAFASDSTLWHSDRILDIICGKECEVMTGSRSPRRGGIFTPDFMEAIRSNCHGGCDVIISGSYLGHDIFGAVYPGIDIRSDSLRIKERKFAREVLGYDLKRAFGSKNGCVSWTSNPEIKVSFPTRPHAEGYCVESPDALAKVPGMYNRSNVIMSYEDTMLPAALYTDFGTYSTAVFGFPLEALNSDEAFGFILKATLKLMEYNKPERTVTGRSGNH